MKNFLTLILLAFLNMWRGSKRTPSLFGVEVCSTADWSSIGVFAFIMLMMTVLAVRAEKHE